MMVKANDGHTCTAANHLTANLRHYRVFAHSLSILSDSITYHFSTITVDVSAIEHFSRLASKNAIQIKSVRKL